MNNLTFSAPWDVRLVLTTILFSCILAGGGAMALSAALNGRLSSASKICLLLGGIVPFVAIAAAVLYSPRRFTVSDSSVTIHRFRGPVEIPLAGLSQVEVLSPSQLSGSVRLLGVSGVFGHTGSFESPDLGRFSMYSTRSEGWVLIRSSDGTTVLTPERPKDFVVAVQERTAKRRI